MKDGPSNNSVFGEWHHCGREESFPPAYSSFEVLLPDGSVRIGYWTGKAWVVGGTQKDPVKWRFIITARDGQTSEDLGQASV
jgi:hypothetical protein